ncbi:diaminopimelate decarboxylase [bacterium]|nr:diaminopimelate decarboxylase [bacterium]
MEAFTYRGGSLLCEDVPVADLARAAGTPLYVYSQSAIEAAYRGLAEAFAPADPLICYAMKANGNLSILKLLNDLGSGFDIVSGGELHRVLRAGADPATVVFAGVAKRAPEIRQAIEAGILMFNVESESELALIDRVAGSLGVEARVALRLNPDVDAGTLAQITTGKKGNKFGIDLEAARDLVARMGEYPNARLVGYHAHIGSQVTDPTPHTESLKKLIAFSASCTPPGGRIEYINIGGGFGIDYTPGQAPAFKAFAEPLLPLLRESGLKLILEPGRSIVGNAGVLVTEVVHQKRSYGRRFIIVDAAMTELIRPMLYDAYHEIRPVAANGSAEADLEPADVVGGVCESTDVLAKARPLPPVAQGDLLAVFSAGAYGFAMSSTYNARPRPCEVLVQGNQSRVVRRRETYDDLIAQETF